jgi:superfamily II DNA helicase RecQ
MTRPMSACRPDYKRLDIFKLKFPRVPLMALTATATPRVQHDVRQQLRIPKSITFKSSFNRPNLRWARAGGDEAGWID